MSDIYGYIIPMWLTTIIIIAILVFSFVATQIHMCFKGACTVRRFTINECWACVALVLSINNISICILYFIGAFKLFYKKTLYCNNKSQCIDQERCPGCCVAFKQSLFHSFLNLFLVHMQ